MIPPRLYVGFVDGYEESNGEKTPVERLQLKLAEMNKAIDKMLEDGDACDIRQMERDKHGHS
jgi:hypothetical protein